MLPWCVWVHGCAQFAGAAAVPIPKPLSKCAGVVTAFHFCETGVPGFTQLFQDIFCYTDEKS